MRFDFNQTVKDLNNKDAVDADGPIRFNRVATAALLANNTNDPKEKTKRFELAMKINAVQDGLVNLTVEESSHLKNCVGQFCSTLVVGRFNQFIEDPNDASKAA